jgi:hypothetical protein
MPWSLPGKLSLMPRLPPQPDWPLLFLSLSKVRSTISTARNKINAFS